MVRSARQGLDRGRADRDRPLAKAPHFGPLFEELARARFGRRFARALWQPDDIVGRRWPLSAQEMSDLLASVSDEVKCSFQTIDRLANDELIAPPLEIGRGPERAQRVYFGRHFVEVAYWQYRRFRPETERARLLASRLVVS